MRELDVLSLDGGQGRARNAYRMRVEILRRALIASPQLPILHTYMNIFSIALYEICSVPATCPCVLQIVLRIESGMSL